MKKINVAVDGTAGSGKSFLLHQVAKIVDYQLIDTGLMYRAFTYYLYLNKIDFNDLTAIKNSLKDFNFSMVGDEVYLNDLNITNHLSSEIVTENINKVTPIKEVRDYMVVIQKELGNKPGIIMLGRDITTIVLPNADLKIYLDAPLEIRATRRYNQNLEQNIKESYNQVLEKLKKRDQSDMNREVGPLKIASDAWYLDTSLQSVEQSVNLIVEKIHQLELEKSYGQA